MPTELTKKLMKLLLQMAETPKTQLKRLVLGTATASISFLLIFVTLDWNNQWLFNFLAGLTLIGAIYAIPGYIGIWMWRMKDTLFKNNKTN